MSEAVLSIGSNLGDRREYLRQAVKSLGVDVRAVSSVFRTPPWGPVSQPDFYNIIVIVDDAKVNAQGWLDRCRRLESDAGRVRDVRWGPRTLDADVISVDEIVSDDPELTLPHPRAQERAFVLVPWAEIDPTAELFGHGPIETLIADLPAEDIAGIVRVGHVD